LGEEKEVFCILRVGHNNLHCFWQLSLTSSCRKILLQELESLPPSLPFFLLSLSLSLSFSLTFSFLFLVWMDYVSRSRATYDWPPLSVGSTTILNKRLVVDGLSWCSIVFQLVCVIRERLVCVAQTSTLDTNPLFPLPPLSLSPPLSIFVSFAAFCCISHSSLAVDGISLALILYARSLHFTEQRPTAIQLSRDGLAQSLQILQGLTRIQKRKLSVR